MRMPLPKEWIDAEKKLIFHLTKKYVIRDSCWSWRCDPDEPDDWKLVLVIPDSKNSGPKKIYSDIRTILDESDITALRLQDITVKG